MVRDMTLQQVDGERVVDIYYHKGEQVSTRCVNESGCKQLKPLIVVRHNPKRQGGVPHKQPHPRLA